MKKQTVKMRFPRDMFYNDPTVALYEAGKVYTIEGADMVQRWLKRGGVIVEGELVFPKPKEEVHSSVVGEAPAVAEEAVELVEESAPEVEEKPAQKSKGKKK